MPDQRLEEAVGHWSARFLANGVDPNDYSRITSSITEWAEWREAWERAAVVHEELGREALRASRWRSAGTHLSQAAVYYHFAKFFWVHDRAEMRATHARSVACFMDSLEHLSPPGRRVEIPFDSGAMVGVLRLPAGDGPHPTVILVPGLDSAKEELRPTEQLFCDRGLATFVVDGPGQGEAEYDLPIRPDWEVPGAAIVDALSAIAEVDAARIGVWGVSLGGYYAPRMASGEQRIRACISMSGPFVFGKEWDQLPQLTRDAFRARSFSATDSEARQRALELSLEGRAGRITIPIQIVAGRLDRIIPAYHADLLANAVSGPVEMLMFEDGGHNCTNINYRHRLRSADWMARQLEA